MPAISAQNIIGVGVYSTSYSEVVGTVLSWAHSKESRYVCIASVNNIMEAHDSEEFWRLTNEADLVTPDGMALVWGLRALGAREATRVYGPDLMPVILDAAQREGIPVGFYGASQATLNKLAEVVKRQYPSLSIPYAYSPPFRPLTPDEDERVVRDINASGARILFVGLNTPKQDWWMAQHRGRVQAVMLGVGAAFDFIAGTKPQAPRWMMRMGLEWLFRLATEPRRLWKRYLRHNPRFVVLFAMQLLGWRRFPS